MLTIAIPTFNRHEKLLRTLNYLSVLRCNLPFEILIVDNFSIPCVSEFLIEKNYTGFEYTQIIRNNGNIGLGPNLLMCFVNTKSEWMWLLGDDDLPIPTCINTIIDEIKDAEPRDFLLKFNSHAGGFPKTNYTISNEHDFLKFCKNFKYYSNMLFISNSIFRVQSMQKYLRNMFEFTNTMAPHIIGILKNVSESNRIKIITKFITEHGITQCDDAWDWHRLREGCLYFSDLKGHKEFKSIVVRDIFQNYISPTKFYKSIFIYPFRYENLNAEYWHWFYWKSAYLFRGFKFIYLVILSFTIRLYYQNNLLNRIISKRILKKNIYNSNRC